MTILRMLVMMTSRWIIQDRSTLVTRGFLKVEVTLVGTGIWVELTYVICDSFEDVGDDEM